MRSCVGCRERAAKSDLLRLAVVVVDGIPHVVPDPRGQRPGRGASLHPDLTCLDLAERRRVFPKAFRLPGPLVATAVREYLEAEPRGTSDGGLEAEPRGTSDGGLEVAAKPEAGRTS